MKTFKEFLELSKTRKRKLANNTYLIVRDDGGLGIKLHATEIIVFYNDRIEFNSGGYQTLTTKERMNRFTPFSITQKNFIWYVDGLPFKDGITFYNDGRVKGVGDDPKETTKLIKKVRQYAINYANAFANGEVAKPNNGDCWGCLFHSKGKTVIAKDHVLSHIKDQYYVPSMLARMFDAGTMSLYVKDVICLIWNKKAIFDDLTHPNMVKNQIAKSIEKFCMRELGLAS
jgi:hypothetical protein